MAKTVVLVLVEPGSPEAATFEAALAGFDSLDQRAAALFAENLSRYLANRPLAQQYDAARGY